MLEDISMKSTGVFVQEFITNPILIDGRLVFSMETL